MVFAPTSEAAQACAPPIRNVLWGAHKVAVLLPKGEEPIKVIIKLPFTLVLHSHLLLMLLLIFGLLRHWEFVHCAFLVILAVLEALQHLHSGLPADLHNSIGPHPNLASSLSDSAALRILDSGH